MNETDLMKLCDYLECNDASMEAQCEAAAELRRLHRVEIALQEWIRKTDWVQETAQVHELGLHRADVLRMRIEGRRHD